MRRQGIYNNYPPSQGLQYHHEADRNLTKLKFIHPNKNKDNFVNIQIIR